MHGYYEAWVGEDGEVQSYENILEVRNPNDVAEGLTIRINLSKVWRALQSMNHWSVSKESEEQLVRFLTAGASDNLRSTEVPVQVTSQRDEGLPNSNAALPTLHSEGITERPN